MMSSLTNPSANSENFSSIQWQALKGVGFTAIASMITTGVGFLRSVLLSRLLAPEDFGVIAFALVFSSFVGALTQFSLKQAFIHSDPEDENLVANTMIILDITLAVARFVMIAVLYPVFPVIFPDYPLLAPILVIFFAAYILGAANSTPLTILERRLVYRRIALLNIITSITLTLVTIILANIGFGVWALVAEVVLTRIIMFTGLFIIRPPWKFSWQLELDFVRRFGKFGLAISTTNILGFLTDQFDDFWTGTSLGKTALGYYAKAYEYARYPRRILSYPIVQVAFPTFSRLKTNTEELSKVFTRVIGGLIRVSFLVAITMYLTAPDLILFFIGPKWTPMTRTFQLMVVYTLIDPLLSIIAMLFISVGKPDITTKIRFLQLALFIPLVIILSGHFGIEGVAIAADLMVVVGLVCGLSSARFYVNFSLPKLLFFPTLALLCTSGVAHFVTVLFLAGQSLIVRLGVESLCIILCYTAVLFAFEHSLYIKYGAYLRPFIQQARAKLQKRHN